MEQNLLQRYIMGDATESEKQSVTEWLEADERNMKEFMALRKLYDITLWQEEETKVVLQKDRNTKTLFLREFLKVAAVIAVVFSGTYFWMQSGQDKLVTAMQTIHVPAGQRVELYLADGTKVWLNAQTTFTFPTDFSSEVRNVKLDGEAFFEVARDESKPFIVETSKYDVRVLGTEFNVIAYQNSSNSETALLKGSVEITFSGTTNKVMLEPNTKIDWDNGKVKKSMIDKYDYFMWRDGLICFENETMESMLKKLELYYDVKIIVNNKKILSNKYTGKFRTKDGIEHVLKVLQLNNKFTYVKDDDKNVIAIN